MKTNPMLLIDFYKAVHAEMLPENITKSVSYMTHRMSRIEKWDRAVVFSIQAFCKTYLIDYFNENFRKMNAGRESCRKSDINPLPDGFPKKGILCIRKTPTDSVSINIIPANV